MLFYADFAQINKYDRSRETLRQNRLEAQKTEFTKFLNESLSKVFIILSSIFLHLKNKSTILYNRI
jgi:hypothetical protein